jgi:hypothetical protein
MSALTVPLARDRSGKLVLPSNATKGAEYWCPECEGRVTFKPCVEITSHFAHKSGDVQGCTGGTGESAQHKIAKEFLATNIDKFEFQHRCKECKEPGGAVARFVGPAITEKRVKGPADTGSNDYVIDVATDSAALEVFHTHISSDKKLADLRVIYDANSVFEVRAEHILRAVERVSKGGVVRLVSTQLWSEHPRGTDCENEVWKRNKRPCVACGEWGDKRTMKEVDADHYKEGETRFPSVFYCIKCVAECPRCSCTISAATLQRYHLCVNCNREQREARSRAGRLISNVPSEFVYWVRDARRFLATLENEKPDGTMVFPWMLEKLRFQLVLRERALGIAARCISQSRMLRKVRKSIDATRMQRARDAEEDKERRQRAVQAEKEILQRAKRADDEAQRTDECARDLAAKTRGIQDARDLAADARNNKRPIELVVPFAEKDEAKRYCAQWNQESRGWYAIGPRPNYKALARYVRMPYLAEVLREEISDIPAAAAEVVAVRPALPQEPVVVPAVRPTLPQEPVFVPTYVRGGINWDADIAATKALLTERPRVGDAIRAVTIERAEWKSTECVQSVLETLLRRHADSPFEVTCVTDELERCYMRTLCRRLGVAVERSPRRSRGHGDKAADIRLAYLALLRTVRPHYVVVFDGEEKTTPACADLVGAAETLLDEGDALRLVYASGAKRAKPCTASVPE